MNEIKQFAGILNTDDANEVIPSQHHKMARNGRFRAGRFENAVGNRLITNTLPSGINKCIGSFEDKKNQRLFYANYNSNGHHGWYILNLQWHRDLQD